jgi:hypothetical protein
MASTLFSAPSRRNLAFPASPWKNGKIAVQKDQLLITLGLFLRIKKKHSQ